MKFEIYTVGCKVNQYESEAMKELFLARGFQPAQKGEISDIYVINTCTVTHLSDRKSRQYISRAKRANREAVVAVVGCYSQVAPQEVKKIEGVDVIVGTKDRKAIVDLCLRAREKGAGEQIDVVTELTSACEYDELSIRSQQEMTRSYIKIQEGCNMYCSYCIIPYARGPIRSRAPEEIFEEARRLAAAGFREAVLTGIHVSSYGKETDSSTRLIDVIEGVAAIDGIDRIRLSSLEPNAVDEEFLSRLVRLPKVCDHFHLSLQSGSDEILKRMNRKYDTKTYAEKIALIRKYYPSAGLTTDVIVGFPGEGEEQFRETIHFLKKIRFTKAHIFPFSRRKGTPAYDYGDQVSSEKKKERSRIAINLEEEIAEEVRREFVGAELSVLFETKTHGEAEGYSTNYLRVAVPEEQARVNEIRRVRILRTDGERLLGEVKS